MIHNNATVTRSVFATGLVLCLAGLAASGPAMGPAMGSAPTSGSQMPKEDVIDVPVIQEGLCVSNLFQTNMVLQRDKPIKVWGWAAPGESVTVTFGGHDVVVAAGTERDWRATLPAMPANAQAQTMTIQGAAATLALENILIGDVWVLGGQSNMEFELAKVENGELEIATANYPLIRILTVPFAEGPELTAGFPRLHEWSDWFKRHFRKGDWDQCSPEIARELSAIGYVFARRVHMASGVPVGVIDASRGGTAVETWAPRAALAAIEDGATQAKLVEWDEKVQKWSETHEPTVAAPGPLGDKNYPGNGYAGMLSPLAGLPIKGVIFHQGFNNSLDGMRGVRLYEAVFPAMIAAWRTAFDDPTMPFGILSLCTEGYPQTRENFLEKMVNTGMHIRAAQYQAFLNLKDSGDTNIGFASTYDLRRRWYHPQVKLPAGERIARWALATQYGFGEKLSWTPPRVLSHEAQDGALLLHLDASVSDPADGPMEGFAIAGADRRFQPAHVAHVQTGKNDRGGPKFDRKQLVLSSPLVAEPIHFRYAWARNPMGNLQVGGHKDLPLATQRSDDWDLGTAPLGVIQEEIGARLSRRQETKLRQALQAEDVRRQVAEARALIEAHPDVETVEAKMKKD